MLAFRHPGFTDVRGEDAACIRREAVLRLPPGVGGGTLHVEGEMVSPCAMEISLGDHVLALLPPCGKFDLKAPLNGAKGRDLRFRLLRRKPNLFEHLTGRKPELSRRGEVHVRRVLLDGHSIADFSMPARSLFPKRAARDLGMGMNIVGFFQHAFGIGESVRCCTYSAKSVNLPAALIPSKIGTGSVAGEDPFPGEYTDEPRYDVNLFHLDAPQMAFVDETHGPALRRGRYNIGYWAWELPEFPDTWLPYFQFVNEVWVPSTFVRDALVPKSPVPVLVMPHAISPVRTNARRADFSIPEEPFVFLVVFDFNSSQLRKNPQCAIAAFQRAFGERKDAHLVIKVHHSDSNPEAREALLAAVDGLQAVTLIDRTMSRGELSALQSCCDCFVSLHRAEGFGMSLAECMGLGKPVLATRWSGNLEFMNEENSCLVNCEVRPIEKTCGPYRRGQHWAEADVEHAAWWMRRLVDEPGLAAEIGARAEAHIRQQLSPERIGGLYQDRLQALYHWL